MDTHEEIEIFRPSVLIIDDQKKEVRRIVSKLEAHGFDVRVLESIAEARILLKSEHGIDTIILNPKLEREDGLDLLRHKPEGCPPVIVVTENMTGKCTIEVMRWGAYDHLPKSGSTEALAAVIRSATVKKEELSPWSLLQQEMTLEPIFGKTEVMRDLQKQVGQAAASDATVLIQGETGTGKDLVAQALHDFSSRAKHRLVPVNCATMPAELLESELFGHVRGAFTGAVSAREGRFREANGGTLFLDEIGDMPAGMQVKLLRAIQQKEIRPLGSDHVVKVDVRIIGATHRNLVDLVQSGHFRQDLFFRLNVINLRVPALREHQNDVPLLADYFLQKHAVGGLPKKLTLSAVQQLMNHGWPGNIRELENLMQKVSVMARTLHISSTDLSLDHGTSTKTASLPQDWSNLPYREAMDRLEKGLLEQALQKSAGNRAAAARRLGLYRQQFYAKLRSFGLL